jgi:hypothetical protein
MSEKEEFAGRFKIKTKTYDGEVRRKETDFETFTGLRLAQGPVDLTTKFGFKVQKSRENILIIAKRKASRR